MTTQTEQQQRRRRSPTDKERVDRLRSLVKRLRAQIKALKGGLRSAPEVQEATSPAATAATASAELVLPASDADGNYPAAETLQVILAQNIVRRREAAGWSQKELAERARVRPETVSRLETGKHAPTVSTVEKLDLALKAAGV